jgi:drug/metabolite transporter (DMT)-like permease
LLSANPANDAARARWLVLSGSAVFALMYTCVKLLGPSVSTFEVLLARSVIGSATCLVLMRRAESSLNLGAWRLYLLRSALGCASIASQFLALHEGECSLSTVSFLRHAAPVWMLVFAGPMLGEWPDRRAALAVAVGVAGVALALDPGDAGTHWGLALAAGAGLFAALALLSVRKLAQREHPLTVVLCFMLFLGSVSLPIVSIEWSRTGFDWTARDAGLLLAASVLGTAGQVLITTAYRYATAISTAVSGLAEVVFTLLFAWTFAGDALPRSTTIAGGATILLAGWLATRTRN